MSQADEYMPRLQVSRVDDNMAQRPKYKIDIENKNKSLFSMNENMKSNTSADGKLGTFLRQNVKTWKDRQDSEHEQAVIRFLVGFLAAAYLFYVLSGPQSIPSAFIPTTITIAGFFLGSLFILAWLISDPGKNINRRIIGCCLDISAATLALYLNGNLAAPLFVVYLWVTFGNGFRYGRPYLFFSMSLSISGYCIVLFTSDLWHINPYLNIGLLAGLIMLPLYVASLLKQLTTALDKAQIASQAKSNFLATMSHEIRTPLNGIIGVTDLLNKTGLDSQQRHYITLLKKSSDWLLQTISDGLDFTKIEADELIIEFAPVNLRELLENLADVYSGIASSKSLSFACKIDENIPDAVECDQFRLFQVLNNLLANAFKFTKQGEVCLSVLCGEQKDGYASLSFSVKDTGKGIAPEDFETIFEPFHQADISTSRQYGGTGLGLSIAGKIVKLMGGRIELESTLGQGSSFLFKLKLKIAEQIKALPIDEKETGIKWQRKPFILLVEDNEVNQEVALHFLEYFGCQVFTCNNGASAVEAVKKNNFDLILMDCQMPVMDGYEAARRIKKMPEHMGKPPIVALTAHTTNEDREKCFAAGMVDYMGKPFEGVQLESLLSRWLSGLVAGYEKKSLEIKPENNTNIISPIPLEKNRREALHELRNKLTSILGNTELALIFKNDPEKLENGLKEILNAVVRATEISSSL